MNFLRKLLPAFLTLALTLALLPLNFSAATTTTQPMRPSTIVASPQSKSLNPTVISEENIADFNVSIDDLNPRVLKKEDKVVISGTVTSRSRTLEPVQLDVYVQPRPALSMEALRSYLSADVSLGRWVGSKKIDKLVAGQSVSFKIEISRSALPLSSDWEWGPRGVALQASSGELETSDRSVLIWDSGFPVESTKVAAIAPLSEDVTVADKNITLAAPPRQKLEVQAQLAQIRGVIAAAPPALLQTDSPLIENGSKLTSPVVTLPVADADTAAIAHLPNSANVLTLVRDSKVAREVTTLPPKSLVDSWVMPQLPRLDVATIAAWKDQTIVAPADIPPAEDLTYRPSAWSRFNAVTGDATDFNDPNGVNVLVPDSEISELLDSPSPSTASELDIQQLLIASTAIITRQLPNNSRTVVAVGKRPDGNYPTAVVDRYRALLQQRWVQPLTATDLAFDKSTKLTARQSLVPRSQTTSGITVGELERLHRAVESTAAMSSAVKDSSKLAKDLRQQVLMVTSLQLRLQPQVRQRLIEGVVERTRKFSQAVKVAQSAPINLLDSKANLPVRVSNDLDEDVSVLVELKPSDPRLQIVETVPVHVPAKSGVLAEIPVRAVASGNVTIQVIVRGPNGLVIDDNTRLTVRVRAEWESTGVAIFGLVLVLLLLVGIIRTVRKGRRMERAEEDDEFTSVARRL